MATVADLIEDLAASFETAGLVFGHGTDNAWDEAAALVLGVTGLADDRRTLAVKVGPELETEIHALGQRRVKERIPLAYLLRRCWFGGREYLIEPGVVIPRSPIAELIERQFSPWLRDAPSAIVDLCAGSGCIGIAAAYSYPRAQVALVELDPTAAEVAKRNVALHGMAGRVEVFEGDLYGALPSDIAEQGFDLILSNPPYVDRTDMRSLPEEFRHEPGLGLAGGDDGLDVVRRIIDGARAHLRPGGHLVCEVGMSAAALSRAYPRLPFLWPVLEEGGEGVFILSQGDLV